MNVLTIISKRLNMPISYFIDEDYSPQDNFEKKFITAENLYIQKNYSEALEIFKSIISLNHNIKNFLNAKSYLYIGKCMLMLNNYSDSIDALNEAAVYLKEISSYENLAECYKCIGDCYLGMYNFDVSIEKYKLCLELIESENLNIPGIKARLLLNTASAYSNIGNFKTAVEYFNKNISYCRDNHVLDTLLDCHVRMAYCLYELKNYKSAREFISKAVSVNKAVCSDFEKAEIYYTYAIILSKEEKFKTAYKLIAKSIELSKHIKYEFGYGVGIAYYIQILIDDGKIEEAKKSALINIKSLKNAQNNYPLHMVYGNLGYAYMLNGEIKEGQKFLVTAIKYFSKANSYHDAYYYCKILADNMLKNDADAAKHYYELSMEYLTKSYKS